MKDSVLATLAADTGVMYLESEPAVVYIDGQYWGLYNLRERVTPVAVAQFEGWDDPDDITLLRRTNPEQGSADAYVKMMKWVAGTDLSDPDNLNTLRQYVDVENYLDMSYRVDRNTARDWLTPGGVGTITHQDNTMFVKLMENAELRDYFLRRMGELLRTTFSAESVTARIEARYNLIAPLMEANCARWGWSVSTWQKAGGKFLSFAKSRPKKMAEYLAESFGLSAAQAQDYFAGVQ